MNARLLVACMLATATVCHLGDAAGQAKEGEFSVQRFEPAPGTRNYFSVEGARVDGQWSWSAGLSFNYAREPFVVVSCRDASNCDDPNATQVEDVSVVRDLFTWDLLGAINPLPMVQIGLRVPLSYASGDGLDVEQGGPGDGISSFGLGDPTLEGKVRFFGKPSDPFVLGAALDISAPLGHATAEDAYIGNDSPVTLGLRGIFDGSYQKLSFAGNLRGVWRRDATLASATIGPELRYGAGLGYQVSPVFRVLGEGFGATRFSSQSGTNSLEIDAGVQVQPIGSGFILSGGVGFGVIAGVGVPVVRGILGLMYSREVGDQDKDGISDVDDKCPTVAEDRDGVEDDDGCLDDDNDRDGVADANDKCPNQAETLNGEADEDGCADELADRDKDGIRDGEDRCPDDAGKLRSKTFYGCPDADGDGVTDKGPAGTDAQWDKCPGEDEDTDGFEDTDGCPDPDNDKDGVLDDADECASEAEVKNGVKDDDGCPD
jgi:hypothetical protein